MGGRRVITVTIERKYGVLARSSSEALARGAENTYGVLARSSSEALARGAENTSGVNSLSDESHDIATVFAARSKRGRPRQIGETERRQLLLDAAEQVFVDQGYTAASMDDIARRAGMSKKTLYQIFDTKESLFAAVIASRREALAAIFGADELSAERDPREALHSFMTKLAGFVLAPRACWSRSQSWSIWQPLLGPS
jgi:hypothetical protein